MQSEADKQRQHGVSVIDNNIAYERFHTPAPVLAATVPGLRIGVSGPMGTGITTTARGLAQRLQLPFLTEVARCAFEHGFTLGTQGSIKAQCGMWFSQLFLEHTEPSFVADRTVADAVAHAELFADRTGDVEDRLVATSMGNATAAALQHFSLLFYAPIEFALEQDGVRQGDIDFQRALDDKFRDVIDRLQLPYIELHGSVDERLDQAMAEIERVQR